MNILKVAGIVGVACGLLISMNMNRPSQEERDEKVLNEIASTLEGTGIQILEKKFYDTMLSCQQRLDGDVRVAVANGYEAADASSHMRIKGGYAYAVASGNGLYAIYCLPAAKQRAGFFRATLPDNMVK